MPKKVIVIGAGVGGITTAIYLAKAGHKVSIYEKNAYSGGRCGAVERNGHRFDIGATLLMMPEVYRNAYSLMGRNLDEELDLQPLDPIYNLYFANGQQLKFSSDLPRLKEQCEAIEPGSFSKILKYMDESYRSYKLSMKHIIAKQYTSAFDFYNPRMLALLFKLKAFRKHYNYAGKYFKNEMLRILFTFQNIYVGQNPYHASAIFSMLSFLEITDGVFAPKGGMHSVTNNLQEIAEQVGVEFTFNTAVKNIRTKNNKVCGITINDNEVVDAELVVCNADYPYAINSLLENSKQAKRVNKLGYTCSAFMFHWGIDKKYEQLEQHNVFVSSDFKKNIEAVFNEKQVAQETSFYLHSPVVNDASAAPEGEDSISAIVPVGHIDGNKEQDFDAMKHQAREAVFSRLAEGGMSDFMSRIKFEICYTPKTFNSLFNVARGSVFGSLSHNLLQMGYMRPSNQHAKYKNLFFVGGSTRPGNGVPMVLISAQLCVQLINKQFK